MADGFVFTLGGNQGNVVPGTVYVYDRTANSWSTGAPMPTPRFYAGGAVVNGSIYVMGGTTTGIPLATVEAYNPVSDTWTTKPNLPFPRNETAGAAAVGRLSGLPAAYLIGGYGGAGGGLVGAVDEVAP